MLTMNLWSSVGICNGVTGPVVDIIYQNNHQPPDLPIAVIIVEFEQYCTKHTDGYFGELSHPLVSVRTGGEMNTSYSNTIGECAESFGETGSQRYSKGHEVALENLVHRYRRYGW